MVIVLKRSWILVLAFCAMSFFLSSCGIAEVTKAEAKARKYVVLDRITPVYEDIESVKNPPKGGWKILPDGMWGIVYGDVVDCEPAGKKGWLELRSEEGPLGFVHESAMTPFPVHESMKPQSFQIVKDKVMPYLLPGSKPMSDYDKFSLPYGTVVTVEGSAKVKDKTWLLCFFGSDYDAELEEGCGAGSERRSGWIPVDVALDLAASTPDLSKVEEVKLPKELDAEARKSLLKNGFYVDPKPVFVEELKTDDMVNAYGELNAKTPKFITADLPLHAFHLYFDRMLQKVEEKVMIGREFELLLSMREAYEKLKPQLEGSDFGKKTAELVDDYLLIIMYLLTNGGTELDGQVADFAEMINEASGTADSPFTGQLQDFTVFKPRGHYTLTDDLKIYFKATYMLGTPFPLEEDFGAAASFVLCHILADSKVQAKWKGLFNPISYLVGSSNVNSYYDLSEAALGFKLGDIGDPAKLAEIMTALDEAAKKSVIQRLPGKKFAILPRRITFDAMVFESLTGLKDASGNERTMPDPLDVMAALGSPAALDEVKKYETFTDYNKSLGEIAQKWQGYISGSDGDNVYTSWLSFAKTYFEPTLSKQFFANSPAWAYKKLTTAEGSVTELKHDTILYAEQSGAEMGDCPGNAATPFALPIARGYVEPEAGLYRAIAESAIKVTEFLKQMFADENEYYTNNLTEFADTMNSLADMSDRAVQDAMTYDDFITILNFSLPNVLPEGIYDIYEESVREQLKMALVADVATDPDNGEALYMATGTPRKIKVYVNDRSGGFRLTEGYMFSYYSFIKALSEGRMDDDQWKSMVYDPAKQDELQQYLPDWHKKINQ